MPIGKKNMLLRLRPLRNNACLPPVFPLNLLQQDDIGVYTVQCGTHLRQNKLPVGE
jgi:hypothetical protein